MTHEEKQLLLKDFCARLPYGVMIQQPESFSSQRMVVEKLRSINDLRQFNDKHPYIEDVKPYLRPMSSMTEDEEKEFDKITNGERGFYEDEDGWIRCDNIHTKWGVWPKGCAEMLDWLNKKMFDYRGLIPQGLALEAPENMYK